MKTTAPSLPAPVGNGSDKREKSGDLANDELDVILQEIEELDSKRGEEGSKLVQAFEVNKNCSVFRKNLVLALFQVAIQNETF